MKILMWIGIVLLIILIVYALIVAAFALYVNNPGTHNASAIDSKASNQYYLRDGEVIYVMDGNFFQIGGKKIDGADPDSFEVIDQSYAKDANTIYYDGKPVTGANSGSVTQVTSAFNINSANSGYLISNGKVFCYGEAIEGADPGSFVYLLGAYAMDNDYLYYYTDSKTPRTTTPAAITNANDRYIRHGDQVLFDGSVISHDAKSFTIISDEYAKDSLHVYSHGKIVEAMVPEGFTVISPYYRKDKNQAYYFNTPIPKSDPSTFKVFNDAVARDKNNLYYSGYIVANKKVSQVSRSDANELEKLWKWRSLHVDPNTVILAPSDKVENITNNFYAYNDEVYSRDKKLAGVKPLDVVVLDHDDKTYVRIGHQVFYASSVIVGANPETFTIISGRFSKDAKHVYWDEHKVVDAAPSTFNYHDNLYADENESGKYFLKLSDD